MTTSVVTAPIPGRYSRTEFATTSGDIALANMQAQIDGLERLAAESRLGTSARIELIELIAQRGHILGRIADAECADDLVCELRREAPNDAAALVAQARSQARFHLFSEARESLNDAARAGADRAALGVERAAVLQAIGGYDEALALLNEAAASRPGISSLGSLAVFHAERGETEAAEDLFDRSHACYRGVSPVPLALLDFQRGHMWMCLRELEPAWAWFASAVRLLPAHAPAQGHLAELEAALGDVETAVARLLPLTRSADDPDYAASLARILKEAGRAAEAGPWQSQAAACYADLVARHPEAFADHAAAFWLEAGNARLALELAQINLRVRKTPRAEALVARAARARDGRLE